MRPLQCRAFSTRRENLVVLAAGAAQPNERWGPADRHLCRCNGISNVQQCREQLSGIAPDFRLWLYQCSPARVSPSTCLPGTALRRPPAALGRTATCGAGRPRSLPWPRPALGCSSHIHGPRADSRTAQGVGLVKAESGTAGFPDPRTRRKIGWPLKGMAVNCLQTRYQTAGSCSRWLFEAAIEIEPHLFWLPSGQVWQEAGAVANDSSRLKPACQRWRGRKQLCLSHFAGNDKQLHFTRRRCRALATLSAGLTLLLACRQDWGMQPAGWQFLPTQSAERHTNTVGLARRGSNHRGDQQHTSRRSMHVPEAGRCSGGGSVHAHLHSSGMLNSEALLNKGPSISHTGKPKPRTTRVRSERGRLSRSNPPQPIRASVSSWVSLATTTRASKLWM